MSPALPGDSPTFTTAACNDDGRLRLVTWGLARPKTLVRAPIYSRELEVAVHGREASS